MTDPCRPNHLHKLIDILTIDLFAVICGANDWVTVAAYGRANFEWRKTVLELPEGIPSHDTFTDVGLLLPEPRRLRKLLPLLGGGLVQLSGGKIVASACCR